MPNANTHKLGAALVVGAITTLGLDSEDQNLVKPATASGLAYVLGTLPDIIEPATSPNHRQFFHSYGFLVLVGVGIYKTWQWKPENEWQKLARFGILVTGGAYTTHLLIDSTTPKGLPIV